MDLLTIQMTPIGYVSNAVEEMTDENWGKVESRITLRSEYVTGLRGLEEFSHVLTVFYMHRSPFTVTEHLVRHPRGREDLPLVGIFSQRARHRPNPIGIAAVELLAVEPDGILVRGLDAIDGTPVLDIKPYVPAFDRVPVSCEPEWITCMLERYF